MKSKNVEKRTLKRTKMVVGLRLPQSQFSTPDAFVHTLDISSSGAKIGALREWIAPGSVLLLQRRHMRAQCRVVWSRNVAPGEIQIGIEFLGREAQFWGFDLEDELAGVWIEPGENLAAVLRKV